MTEIYRQSRRCDAAIKEEEGWRDEAYQDLAGVWTIAYGHTKNAKRDLTCTRPEGQKWLDEDMSESRQVLARMLPDQVFNQGQVDALISFIHNFGETKFRRYSLYRLIRDGASDAVISEKWLDYVYTIRDEDMDGDLDAMIDNGLPIRRYREMLMFNGFSYTAASAAANMDTLNLNDTRMEPWKSKGGEKEVFNNRIPASEIIMKAHSVRAIFGEGLPGLEPALTVTSGKVAPALSPPSPKPEPETDALPEDWAEKTPNEKTRWLNLRSLRKAGGEVAPAPAPVKVRPPVEVVELNDVPYISNPTPKSKKMADSRRGRGFAKQEVAKHAGFVAAGGWAAESVGAVEPTVKFVEKYSSQTIAWVFLAIGVFAVGYYFFGKWQQQLGEDEAEDHLH